MWKNSQKSLRFIAQKRGNFPKKFYGLPPGLLLSRKTGSSTIGGFGHNTQDFYEGTIKFPGILSSCPSRITGNPHTRGDWEKR